MSEGRLEAADDSSLGRWCLLYCVIKMDDVKHLPNRENLFTTSPLGGRAIIAATEMSYTVRVGLFKEPGDCAGPAGSGSLFPLGFLID